MSVSTCQPTDRRQNSREIRDVLLEAISHWGWQERIRHDPDTQMDFVSTIYIKHNDAFTYTLTSCERHKKVGIHITSPIQAPKARLQETIVVANYFNARSMAGSYHVTGAGDLCYLWMVSIAGLPLGIDIFRTLRDAGNKAFDESYNSFLTAAFTNKRASEVIQNHQAFWSREKNEVSNGPRAFPDAPL